MNDREIFSREGRKQALREFTDKAKRFFLADLTDEELGALACELNDNIEDVYRARGGGKWTGPTIEADRIGKRPQRTGSSKNA